MKNSVLGKLNFWDILKGAGLAALTTIITALITFVNAGAFPTFWTKVIDGVTIHGWDIPIYSAIGAFLAYLLKNLLSNSDGQPFTKEKPADDIGTIEQPK